MILCVLAMTVSIVSCEKKEKGNNDLMMVMLMMGGGESVSDWCPPLSDTQPYRTGRTTCYDAAGNLVDCAGTGQDGDLKKGLEWPGTRFSDNGDGTVTDSLTGLMWQKSPDTAAKDWTTALGDADSSTLGTHDDWRLPNADELRSLFGNYGEDDVRTWLNGQGFSGIQLGYYWSSTTETGSTADAYCVNSEVGSMIGQAKSGTYRAIIVRGTSGNLPKTGQTTAYDGTRTDDEDGDLELGIAWPGTRFTDNGDGTMTDSLTGLMWLQHCNCMSANYPGFDTDHDFSSDGDGAVTWQHALDFVEGVNNGTYSNCGGVYTNWRLPNVNELESLYNGEESVQATWLTGQGFTDVVDYPEKYWSSTTYEGSRSMAWLIDATDIRVAYGSKANENHVMIVRCGI